LVAGFKKLPLDIHPGSQENQEKKETYMSKNLTRKGLALGAVVALGTSLFASAPAQAASVLFAPTTGTGNTLVAGETFSLTASLSSDLPASNSTQLKFKVANTTGVAATVTLNNKTIIAAGSYTAVHGTGYAPVALDSSVGGTTSGSTLTAGTASSVFGVTDTAVAEWTTGTQVVAGAVSTATNPTTIKIASTAATTASYTVTAFLDANNNGVVDSGELSSAQTVNFVKIADSGLTTTFTKPSIASAALKAVLTFGADVNVAQLTASRYSVAYGVYGVSGKTAAESNTVFTTGSIAGDTVDAYDATNYPGKLISNATASATPSTGVTYSAQPVFGGALVASEVFQVVAASADADPYALTVAPAISNDVVGTSTTGLYNVRAGVAATAVKATIKKTPTGTTVTSTSGVAVGAGVVVNVTVSNPVFGTTSGATAADTITVNGVAVTSANASSYATTVVTDANGVVTVPVVTTSGAATDSIVVTLTVPNATSAVTGAATLTWAAAALTAPVDLIVGSGAVHTAVKGGSYTASYALRDQFNALYTGSAYRLVFTAPGYNGGTAPTSQTGYVPFVNGIATVTLTDNSTGAGSNAASYIIEKQTNGLWAQAASPLNTTVQAPFTVTATAPVAAAVTAVVSTSNTAREIGTTFATVDQRVNYNGVAAPASADLTASSINTLGGQVTDASGVGVAGAQVTIAAAGVQFVSGSVYAIGSITVSANATGTYTVDAYSHTAGKVTFTVTSGAATKTASVTYAAAVQANLKTTTVTIPSTSQTGRAVAVVATVADKFGNPVVGMTVSFSATGVGSLSAATAVTDANGVAQVKLVTQQGEDGDAVVTVSHLGADNATTTDAQKVDDFTSSKTVTFGVADANVDIVNNRVTAVATFTKGKTVSFYVDGIKKWSKASASDADVVVNYNLKKGTHTVTVKISGGFSTVEKFIVK
jgi:hypothetical protein